MLSYSMWNFNKFLSSFILGELYTYAAELATEAMKGKLAAKYYMQAEEAWAECEEWSSTESWWYLLVLNICCYKEEITISPFFELFMKASTIIGQWYILFLFSFFL